MTEYYNCLALPQDLELLVFRFKWELEKKDHQKTFVDCINAINKLNYDLLNIDPKDIWGKMTPEQADDSFNNVENGENWYEEWGTKSFNMLVNIADEIAEAKRPPWLGWVPKENSGLTDWDTCDISNWKNGFGSFPLPWGLVDRIMLIE